MHIDLVTGPIREPVSLAEAKEHLRIEEEFTDDDNYVRSLISGARAHCENILWRKLITQTWDLYLDAWPAGRGIKLPYGKLQSVTYIKYMDTDDTETELADTEYSVDTISDPGRIVLGYGKYWPTVTLKPSNPIVIRFVCGYGDHDEKTITDATNASPIVVTITAHGYFTGHEVYIKDVKDNTAANGFWQIEVAGDDSFKLIGSTGNGDYSSSGGKAIKYSVPSEIRQAMLILITDLFEQRQITITGTIVATLKTVENLLGMHSLYSP